MFLTSPPDGLASGSRKGGGPQNGAVAEWS